MHAFHQACSARHIFEQPQNFHPGFCRNTFHTGQKLFYIFADFGTPQVLIERKSCHDPARDIVGQARYFIDVASDVVFGTIGQERIGIEGAALCFRPHGGAGHRACIDGFGQVHHLDKFILDVRGISRSLILGSQGRSPDNNIGYAAFAASVVLPVQGGETLDEHAAEFNFAAHKNPIPGDENIFKDNKGFTADNPEFLVSGVNPFFKLSFLVGLAAENKGDPF